MGPALAGETLLPYAGRSTGAFAAVHVREEQILPARRAVLHAAGAVEELRRPQNAMRSDGEDDAWILQHPHDVFQALGGIPEALVDGGCGALVASDPLHRFFERADERLVHLRTVVVELLRRPHHVERCRTSE